MTANIAKNLLENAQEFTKRASIDLENNDCKFSLIHFCSAIEQILKARLVLEHWTLIIGKNDIDSANLEGFQEGLFKTITITSVLQRSANLYDNLSKPYVQCIKALFSERNKIIHFYSSEIAQKKEQVKIVRLICRAWYLTHKIIDTTKEFDCYKKKFNLIDEEMKRFDKYLSIIFEENKALIESLKNEGNDIACCEGCRYPSFQGDKSGNFIKKGKCITCGHKEYYLKIHCAACRQANYLFHSNLINLDLECSNEDCKAELNWDNYDVVRELGGLHDDPKHGTDYASCNECEHQYCVGFLKRTILCANCLCEHDAIYDCEFCGEVITDYKEGSYLSGCGFCEGRLGHEGLA